MRPHIKERKFIMKVEVKPPFYNRISLIWLKFEGSTEYQWSLDDEFYSPAYDDINTKFATCILPDGYFRAKVSDGCWWPARLSDGVLCTFRAELKLGHRYKGNYDEYDFFICPPDVSSIQMKLENYMCHYKKRPFSTAKSDSFIIRE